MPSGPGWPGWAGRAGRLGWLAGSAGLFGWPGLAWPGPAVCWGVCLAVCSSPRAGGGVVVVLVGCSRPATWLLLCGLSVSGGCRGLSARVASAYFVFRFLLSRLRFAPCPCFGVLGRVSRAVGGVCFWKSLPPSDQIHTHESMNL